MEDLQAKLEQAQAKRDAIFTDIESLRINEAKADVDIEAIKTKIEAAKKPKLRHGDYGINEDDGSEFVLTLQSSQDKFFYSDGGGQIQALKYADNHTVLGNIFDDLAAMQEDVTDKKMHRFNTDMPEVRFDLTVQRIKSDIWLWSSEGMGIKLGLEKLTSLRLLLQQTEATLKRKQARA